MGAEGYKDSKIFQGPNPAVSVSQSAASLQMATSQNAYLLNNLDLMPPRIKEPILQYATDYPQTTWMTSGEEVYQKFCDDFSLFMDNAHKSRAEYAFLGNLAQYCCQTGDRQQVQEVGKFFILITFVDDVLDTLLDINEVIALISDFALISDLRRCADPSPRSTPLTSQLRPEIWEWMRNFLATDSCTTTARDMASDVWLKYVDFSLVCRISEIQGRYMWLDEYRVVRSFNVAMSIGHVMQWFCDTEMDTCALKDPVCIEAVYLSAYPVAIVLDMLMYKARTRRPNRTKFSNLVGVLEGGLGFSRDSALGKVDDMFMEYEELFLVKICELEERYPMEAEALRRCHVGALHWGFDTKIRYAQG